MGGHDEAKAVMGWLDARRLSLAWRERNMFPWLCLLLFDLDCTIPPIVGSRFVDSDRY